MQWVVRLWCSQSIQSQTHVQSLVSILKVGQSTFNMKQSNVPKSPKTPFQSVVNGAGKDTGLLKVLNATIVKRRDILMCFHAKSQKTQNNSHLILAFTQVMTFFFFFFFFF